MIEEHIKYTKHPDITLLVIPTLQFWDIDSEIVWVHIIESEANWCDVMFILNIDSDYFPHLLF